MAEVMNKSLSDIARTSTIVQIPDVIIEAGELKLRLHRGYDILVGKEAIVDMMI